MKYRLAEGCLAFSFAGKQIAVARDGTVDLDAAAAAALGPHGAVVADAAPADRDAMGATEVKRPGR